MSSTIDERIVEMQFNNRQFEANVQTSMSTLDKLKQKLNLTGAAKGFESINTAANRVNFSGMVHGIEQVGVKFSYLQATIQHQINNLVDSTINAGKRMASALTIDPIKSGFQEYETQINSVQTILANTSSKGTTLEDVNSALDTLNTYADKTIYNFTEMTRNIGTFTAAGVDLDTSVNAIQGIANLAAVSGSTSQQASTAMYQLSQALASGTVKLQDWNSVVNAGMGGQVFQDALARTAAVMSGSANDVEGWRKKNIDSYGSFRDSLTQGAWLTTEVLTNTLSQFTGNMSDAELKAQGYTDQQIKDIQAMAQTANDAATKVKTFTQLWDTLKEAAQSGWTQTWETIVGDFEEAKELLTKISDVVGGFIGSTSESRNALLSGALDTNWEKMLKKINEAGIQSSTFEEKLKETVKAHGYDVDALIKDHGSLEKAFRSGAISSDILKEAVSALSGSLVDLSKIEGTLKKGDKGDDVKQAQEALKNLGYDLGKTGVDGSFGSITETAVKSFQELNGLEVTGIIDEKTLEALEEATKKTEGLSEACNGLIDKIEELGGREILIQSLKNVFEGFKNIAKPIKEAFRDIFPKMKSEQLLNFIKSFEKLTAKFKDFTAGQSDNIKTTFEGIFSVLDIGWDIIKKLAGGIVTLFGNFSGLGGSVLDTTASIGEWLIDLRDSVKTTDIFGQAIDKVVGFLSLCITKLKDFGKSIRDSFKGNKFEGFAKVFSSIWNIIKNVGSKISGVLSSIGSGLSGLFDDPNLFNSLNSGLFAGILVWINKLVKGFADIVDGIGGKNGFIETVTETLDDVRGCFEAYQTQLKAGALLKIAGAIGILAAAIVAISLVDSEDLDRAIGAITILFVELIAAMSAFTNISGDTKGMLKANLAMSAMISMSVAIVILAGALKSLGSMSWEEIGKGVSAMALALIAITAAMALMPKNWSASLDVAGKKFGKLGSSLKSSAKLVSAGIMFIAVAAAMKIFASAMADFAKLEWEEIAKGLSSIVIILAVVTGLINKMSKTMSGNLPGHMVGFGIGMIAMAAAVKVFASAVGDFAKYKWEDIGKGIGSIAVILLGITLAINKLPKTGALNMIGLGIGMIAMAAAITILINVLERIKGFSWEEIVKGIGAIAVSLIALSVAIAFVSSVKSGAGALLVAAAALSIIASVIKTVGSMPLIDIIKGLGALATSLIVIGAASVLLQPVVPAILAMSAALAVFGVAILAIGAGVVLLSVGFAALATAGAAGATALVAALTIIITGVANLIPTIVRIAGDLILALCEVIGECAPQLAVAMLKLIVEVLKALETYGPQIVDSLLGFLIGVLRSLAEHLPELIVVAAEVIGAFFQGVVDALSGMDTANIFKGIVGVAILSGLMFALSAVVSLIPGAMIGVLGMGAVIAELALVIAAIGALAQIPGLNWLIGEGGQLLEGIGTAIGQFIGGIVGGIAQGFTSSLPQIGTDLSNFMTNVQPFIDGISNVDTSMVDGVKTLAETILVLTGAELISGITSFIGGNADFSTFSSQLAAFGSAIVGFSNTVSGSIDVEAVNAAASAGAMMAELQSSLYGTGGIIQWFCGEKDFRSFGAQLLAFGTAIVGFSNKVSEGVNIAAVEAAANAGAIMAKLQESLYGTGGVIQWFCGEKDFALFGMQLVAFGTAIVSFSKIVSAEGAINESAIEVAARVGSLMTTLQEKIVPTGGVVQWFCGEQNFATFGSQLVSFGQALVDFSNKVSGNINEDAISAAANAGTMMTTLQASIPEDKWLDGKVSLDDFGKQIKKFGEKMVEFSEEVIDINVDGIHKSAAAISNIQTVIFAVRSIGDTSELNFDVKGIGTAIKDYSNEVSDISATAISASAIAVTDIVAAVNKMASMDNSGIGKFKAALVSLSTADIDSFVNKFTSASGKMKGIGADMINALIDGMENRISSLKVIGIKCVNCLVDTIGAKQGQLAKSGTMLMTGVANGMNNARAKLPSAMTACLAAVKASISNQYLPFYNAGSYLVDGFKNGISANSYKAAAQAAAMAKAAKQAAEEALGIQSPSKVFYQIGDYTGQGFVNALKDYGDTSYKAGAGMADSARLGLSNAISKITDVVNSDMQPTIRPVLDLSDVESGAGYVNGLFGNGASLGVMANINAINSSMNRRIQNGANGDIVSAIDGLRKDLGNISGNSYVINGMTYDDGSNVASAIGDLIRAAKIERRV